MYFARFGTDPSRQKAHFDTRVKSFKVQQKHISLCEEAVSNVSLTKTTFRKNTERYSFKNNQETTPSCQRTPVHDFNGEESLQTNVSVMPVIHENPWPQTNTSEKAQIFNQQPTKRPPTAAT